MEGRSVRLATLLVAASLLGASCSASGPSTASKAVPTHHALHHTAVSTTTTVTTANSGTGTGSGSGSGTGDSGSGNTGTGASTSTVGSPSTTTVPGRVVITKSGRIRTRNGPVISKFNPLSSQAGGTVIIYGKRLGHATLVSFDGLPGAITFNSSGRIRAVVPAGATSGPISVVTPRGVATLPGFLIV